MSKVRIYTLAKDLGVENQKLLEILDSLGVAYKSVSSTLDEETVESIKGILASEGGSTPAQTEAAPPEPAPTPTTGAQPVKTQAAARATPKDDVTPTAPAVPPPTPAAQPAAPAAQPTSAVQASAVAVAEAPARE
ncbi:translation initiation factor IF-2 N-terminal domain-containing protein, partial [Deinococcus sp.]|uniref:translation initiation factor IF-2 N-terminal domain-containing protein n=1 Tax=Deinococcus sp. TaxID=47478 RepID=UPI00286D7AE5